jgi:hypothetical protein
VLLLVLALGWWTSTARAADEQYMVELVARSFIRGVLAGDVQSLLPLCSAEVSLDGQPAKGAGALTEALGRLVKRARENELKLEHLVVWPVAVALQRFGPPPRRMQAVIKPGRWVALAAFKQATGVVLILARERGFWRVVGLTD